MQGVGGFERGEGFDRKEVRDGCEARKWSALEGGIEYEERTSEELALVRLQSADEVPGNVLRELQNGKRTGQIEEKEERKGSCAPPLPSPRVPAGSSLQSDERRGRRGPECRTMACTSLQRRDEAVQFTRQLRALALVGQAEYAPSDPRSCSRLLGVLLRGPHHSCCGAPVLARWWRVRRACE